MSETSFKPKHGLGRYKKQKCRCEDCVTAYNTWSRNYQAEKIAKRMRNKLDAAPLIDLLYAQVETHSSLGRKLRRWKYEGVDIYTADKICCELGYHPFEVFGDSWWKGAFDE